MRTARDIRNYIVYAWEEGYKEGLVLGQRDDQYLQRVAERLREGGLSEEEILSIIGVQTQEIDRQQILELTAKRARERGFSEEDFQRLISD